MYVCLCVGVTERDIKELVREGACSVEDVAACTGAGTRCGTCRSSIAAMVADEGAPPETGRRRLAVVRIIAA
jgi:bacterioferritin-associated ferredoxin